MLLVLFNIGNQRYGLDTKNFVEIIPSIPLTPLSDLPDYIPGLFDYRGKLIPVIDITHLIHQQASHRLISTRIILVEIELSPGNSKIIGLLAEKMTDILETEEEQTQNTEENSYLGPLVRTAKELIQCIDLDKLINSELKSILRATTNITA